MQWESDSSSSVEKQRRRDEKARQARQVAIQELNQKRERKKEENKRMAEDELVKNFLFCYRIVVVTARGLQP